MPLTIYGTSRSRAFRVLWMATELELDFVHEPLSWQVCASHPPYLALNPSGTIPALDDNGFVLSESLAINLYLAQKAGQLWPSDLQQQARVHQWTLWVATTLETPYTEWAAHTYWSPEAAREPAVAAAAATRMRRPLDRLELALTQAPYLLGEHFSVADLNVVSVIAMVYKFEPEQRPALGDWLARCRARPAFRQAGKLP